MPYRIDIDHPPADAVDVLVDLGALDIEPVQGGVAAMLPDGVTPEKVVDALGGARVAASAAVGRDNGSVWLLSPRTVRIGNLLIASPDAAPALRTVRLTDAPAFGSGHHPTTALCVKAIEDILAGERVDSVLDVGTGSGILASVALTLGVPKAVGLDIDAEALRVASENAHLNGFADRFELVLGGPEIINGQWPLVVANVMAAPLIDMAPVLIRRVRTGGQLILSGIPLSLEAEVKRAYQRCGMGHIGSTTRSGWTTLIAQASW